MSDDNTPTPQGPTSTQDSTTQPSKGRQPDFIIHTTSGEGDNIQWQKIGAAWEGKNGYLNANITAAPLNGKLVFQPRAELERLRQQKQAAGPTQQPTQNPSQ